MAQDIISVIGATRITVGLSTILKVSIADYETAKTFKIFSGGTLEIVEPSSTTGWGTGYPLGTSEVMNISGPAVFYLAATGTTIVGAMIIGRTNGATVI